MVHPVFRKTPIDWLEEKDGSWSASDPYRQKVEELHPPSLEDEALSETPSRPPRMISYRVARLPGGGYEAQADEGPGEGHDSIGRFATVDEAKQRAQEHADRRVNAR